MRYLEVDDLLHIVERATGRQAEVRDAGQLAAAVARPKAALRGKDVYPSVGEKAAALLVSLATSKGLHHGNKRLAWTATRLFCAANGAPLHAEEEDAVATVRAVSFGDLDVAELAERLGLWMTPEVVPDP
jgi:death-on-curing protein